VKGRIAKTALLPVTMLQGASMSNPNFKRDLAIAGILGASNNGQRETRNSLFRSLRGRIRSTGVVLALMLLFSIPSRGQAETVASIALPPVAPTVTSVLIQGVYYSNTLEGLTSWCRFAAGPAYYWEPGCGNPQVPGGIVKGGCYGGWSCSVSNGSLLPNAIFSCPSGYKPVEAQCIKRVCPDANPPYKLSEDTLTCSRDELYTLTLEIPAPAEVEPSGIIAANGHTKLVIAKVVNTQSGQPKTGVQVSLSVDVQANSGGHNHDAGRHVAPHTGTLSVSSGTTAADGTVGAIFSAPAASGIHTVTATCNTCTNKTVTGSITVKVDGLVSAGTAEGYFVFIGSNAHHSDNHYLTPAALNNLGKLARYYHLAFPTNHFLHVNDASLVWGGLFDICSLAGACGSVHPWTSPHSEHRKGTAIDVRANQLPDAIPNSNDAAFQDMIKDLGGKFLLENPGTPNEHYHIKLHGFKG